MNVENTGANLNNGKVRACLNNGHGGQNMPTLKPLKTGGNHTS